MPRTTKMILPKLYSAKPEALNALSSELHLRLAWAAEYGHTRESERPPIPRPELILSFLFPWLVLRPFILVVLQNPRNSFINYISTP